MESPGTPSTAAPGPSGLSPRLQHYESLRLAVYGGNTCTVNFVRSVGARRIAEVGIYEGATSEALARYLDNRGELHLFDFASRVEPVVARLRALGYTNVVGHGNSEKLLDSYNWSLMRVLQAHTSPCWDYVYLDGAHTWELDALAFLLIDRLLVVGGHIDFDDYAWSPACSPSMNPAVRPLTAEEYTNEQIAEQHVARIVELLVRRDPRYLEIVPNKVFRKIGIIGGDRARWIDRRLKACAVSRAHVEPDRTVPAW